MIPSPEFVVNENPNSDYLVSPGATDSINDIAWHPTNSEYISAGSWDKKVRCWKINNGKTDLISSISHEKPVLSVCFNGDGTKIFSGSCDNTALCWDLISDKPLLAAQHSAPVKYVHWLDERNCLMTASWDKTIKYWDGRSSKSPVITYELEERVYAADVKDNLAVVGLAEKHVLIFDLNYPQKPFRTLESPLKFQTRSISCFIDHKGFAIGSIEGRVAIHHCELTNQNLNFAFKCHRDTTQIFAINSIDFHPIFNTFATTGSDGLFHFWDKDAKQRLKQFKKLPLPIICSKFNPGGNIFAYAVGYDWSQGCEGYNDLKQKNSLAKGGLFLHSVIETEIKGRVPRRL
jgi:mRNA export factor